MPSDNQDRIEQLRAQLQQLHDEAQGLVGDAQAAELSQETIARLEEIEETRDHVQAQLDARMRMERLAQGQGGGDPPQRRSEPAGTQSSQRRTIDHGRRDPTAGFGGLGEFAGAVAMASHRTAPRVDDRLAQMAPSTWSQESAGGDGGYLVPPGFSSTIMEYVGEENSLWDLCTKTPVGGATLNWPTDEDAPWSSNGPQAYWEGEGDQATQSKVHIGQAGVRLNKLVCLCPVTDELLEDAPQLGAYLSRTIGKKLRWKIDNAIINGTGAGMPLGVLAAPCLKTVAARSAATEISSTDVINMWTGMFGEFRNRGTWIYNQDCEGQLMTMVVAGSSSDVPVYLPSGSTYGTLAGRPQTTIMGRPAITHQACQTLGTAGDILFADMSQYLIGAKTMGPQMASSIHLYFDYDMTAVRATWRLTGMPLWSKTIAANNGSATYSPFVALSAST